MGVIEAWCDGACEPINPGGHAAWGAVVKVDGQVVRAWGGYIGHGPSMSNNVAEYCGAIAALEEASKYSGPIVLRGDSKLVIMQMSGQWSVNGGLYLPYYEKAQALLNGPLGLRVSFEWVPREENAEADSYSKQQLKDRGVKLRL